MIEIILPFPDSTLFPNRRHGAHWSESAKAKKDAKQLGHLLTASAMFGREPLTPNMDHSLTIVINPPDRIRRDVDGLLGALKPTLDGMSIALGVDDSFFNPITIQRGEPFRDGRVTVIIDDLPF